MQGRDRKVILEGGKRPREERPFEGVNNAVVGERIRVQADILGAAAPQGGKRHGGEATGASTRVEGGTEPVERGEKPLKGRCPWTIQHETGLADTRHEQSGAR